MRLGDIGSEPSLTEPAHRPAEFFASDDDTSGALEDLGHCGCATCRSAALEVLCDLTMYQAGANVSEGPTCRNGAEALSWLELADLDSSTDVCRRAAETALERWLQAELAALQARRQSSDGRHALRAAAEQAGALGAALLAIVLASADGSVRSADFEMWAADLAQRALESSGK